MQKLHLPSPRYSTPPPHGRLRFPRAVTVAAAALALACSLAAMYPSQAAVAPPRPAQLPTGKYTCYQAGFRGMSYNGVTVVIAAGGHYSTLGAKFTGDYQFDSAAGTIRFATGKLAGLKSWYTRSAAGQAIHIAFHNGKATNTAVCGRVH